MSTVAETETILVNGGSPTEFAVVQIGGGNRRTVGHIAKEGEGIWRAEREGREDTRWPTKTMAQKAVVGNPDKMKPTEPSNDPSEGPAQKILAYAQGLLEQSPTWPTFFREIFGPDGIVDRCLPKPEMKRAFADTPEGVEVKAILNRLRNAGPEEKEQLAVVTVRMPDCMREMLKEEAHIRKTSMNKLCVAKLLQPLPEDTPVE